jgi:hypothetical protein
MAQALSQVSIPASVDSLAGQQLGLYGAEALAAAPAPVARPMRRIPVPTGRPRATRVVPLCKSCRTSEARYGFQQATSTAPDDRPRTLCFQCFREELDRRQAVAARISRGQYEQGRLPLDETLRTLSRRRHRAQIAARHALGL